MIIGLDLETTGLTVGSDRIIELCFGLYDNKFNLMKNITMRFNPRRPIDPKAQAVHHISLDQLVTCPHFEDKAPVLNQILSKADLIVIHNARFDAPFLRFELENSGQQAPSVPVYDTMAESRWATPEGKWPKLGELCFACGVSYSSDEAHAAEYDVNKMMECFKAIKEQGFFSGKVSPFNEIQPFQRRK